MRATFLLLPFLLAACAPSPEPSGGGDAPPAADGGAAPIASADEREGAESGEAEGDDGDPARIARLEARARALARAGGCQTEAGCATAPVGSRPCGGPREHLVYCAESTDTAALLATLRELAAVEERYNRAQGLMSTCEMRLPPRVALEGGECRAVAGGVAEEEAPGVLP